MSSHATPASLSADPRGGPRVIESSQLFDPQHKTVKILHQGEHYTLRLTASNKLILTK